VLDQVVAFDVYLIAPVPPKRRAAIAHGLQPFLEPAITAGAAFAEAAFAEAAFAGAAFAGAAGLRSGGWPGAWRLRLGVASWWVGGGWVVWGCCWVFAGAEPGGPSVRVGR
jgi:hypothetical protein